MRVSIVIPARNAGETLGETLESVRAQRHPRWEAIVVDDGSEDDTARVAARQAQADRRIRVVGGFGGGVSAARNRGIEHARFDHLLFLDADDLIQPGHLEELAAGLRQAPDAPAACSAWARLSPDGRIVSRTPPRANDDMFALLGRHSAFPIHTCLVRRDLVEQVGCFDSGLTTCEDWDLWQRVARTGARFLPVDGAPALYRMRPGSATLDPRRFLLDGLEVIERGHSSDWRVPRPLRRYAEGLPRDELSAVRLRFGAWVCALAIGCGQDPLELLDLLRDETYPELETEIVAESVLEAVLLPRCLTPDDWPGLWPQVEQALGEMLAGLETASGTAGLRQGVERALERRIARLGVSPRSALVGTSHTAEIDLESPFEEVRPPQGAERVVFSVAYGTERLGVLELPVCDGIVTAGVLTDAVAAEWGWRILGMFFAATVYPGIETQLEDGTWRAMRGKLVVAEEARDSEPDAVEFHDAVGWTVLLQEVWDRPEWPAERFYDPLAESIGDMVERDALERQAFDLAFDPVSVRSGGDLTLALSVGGSALGFVSIAPTDGIVSSSAIRAQVTTLLGFELVTAVVREAVLGTPLSDRRSLRARLAARLSAHERERFESDVLVLRRRRPFTFGTPASRRSALPAEAAATLLRAAAAAGEEVSGGGDSARPRQVVYLPEQLPRSAVAYAGSGHDPRRDAALTDPSAYDRRHFESLVARGADPWSYTSPYEQTKYDQTLELLPPEARGDVLELACAEGHFTAQLAPHVEHVVAADLSAVALERARERCSAFGNVEFARLDLITDSLPGRAFDAVVCSEVLYYVDREALGGVAAKLAAAVRPGGYLLLAHANLVSDAPDQPGFDWGLPFGALTIGAAFESTPGLRLVRELRTPLYRIQLFRRERLLSRLRRTAAEITAVEQPTEVPDRVKPSVRWNGGRASSSDDRPSLVTERLPILMYHRVAVDGPPELARYRVSPAAFDEQLAYLREAGYRSVGLGELEEAMRLRRPLPGRCVLLTFDDAYRDFADEAWPCLKRHGFCAALFVVTDRVGGRAEWDLRAGGDAPLLGWDQLELLTAEGLEIGSHSASHPRLTGLSIGTVVDEAARSRAEIAERLGIVPQAFAYPYGDHDGVVEHLLGACGYSLGFTIRGDHARLGDRFLSIPRIEVSGATELAAFVRQLEPGHGDVGASADGAHDVPEDGLTLAYEPELLPPVRLMRTEGIDVLEEWYRWAEEWSVLLRVYGGLTDRSSVLEIGCGLGRIAFALRYLLSPSGSYCGFEIVREKIEFLERAFAPRYPNFRFTWADVHNTYYNPTGATPAAEYRFPYPDDSFGLVFAASVFTHTLPDVARRYMRETARVLSPGGRAVFSFFLLDHYRTAAGRPSGFDHSRFDLEHAYEGQGEDFRIANPRNPEEMTGFRRAIVEQMAVEAGLEVREVVPGRWSGSFPAWISSQDLVVLTKRT